MNAEVKLEEQAVPARVESGAPATASVHRLEPRKRRARSNVARHPVTHVKLLKHRVRTPVLLVAAMDGLFCFAVALIAHVALTAPDTPLLLLGRSFLASVAIIVSMLAMGLYDSGMRGRFTELLLRSAVAAIVLAPIGAMLVSALTPRDLFVAEGFFVIAIVSLAFVTFSRQVVLRVLDNGLFRRRIIVLGTGQEASRIVSRMRRRSDRLGFEIVGFVNAGGPDLLGDAVRAPRFDLSQSSLMDLCSRHGVDEVVIAQDDRRRGASARLPIPALLDCRMAGIETTELQAFFERESGRIDLDVLRPSWLLFSREYGQPVRRGLKRLFDVTASSVLLALAWPWPGPSCWRRSSPSRSRKAYARRCSIARRASVSMVASTTC